MKLEDTGEAFFIEEVECPDGMPAVPNHLATSPIPMDSLSYIGEALERLKDEEKEQGKGEEENEEGEEENEKVLENDDEKSVFLSNIAESESLPSPHDPFDVNMNDHIDQPQFRIENPVSNEENDINNTIENQISNKCLIYQVVCKYKKNICKFRLLNFYISIKNFYRS